MDEDNEQPLSPQWIKSPSYRVVHSNLFRYRLNMGDMTLHFDTVTDIGPPGAAPVTVIAEVSVAMSWPQAKSLMGSLEMAIRVIEKELGTIPMPKPTPEGVKQEEEKVLALLRGLYSRSGSKAD